MRKRQRWRMAYWQDVLSPPVSFSASAQAGVAAWRDPGYLPGGTEQVQPVVTTMMTTVPGLFSHGWKMPMVSETAGLSSPPLFAMQGKKENTLRIIDATNNQLPQDRESLFG